MGFGPSTKMTTLHHYHCPLVNELIKHHDLNFPGVIIAGVSENYTEKVFVAKRVGSLIDCLQVDGAIVSIDGWGNHHVDFVAVLEEIGKRQIPSVGLSYFGIQGKLVCDSPYLDTLIDFNKSASGFESSIVGQNNLAELDAFKAVAILRHKLKLKKAVTGNNSPSAKQKKLTKHYLTINKIKFSHTTKIVAEQLFLKKQLPNLSPFRPWIRDAQIKLIQPEERHTLINTVLDFSPLACKINGELGEGETLVIKGVSVMTTGVEAESNFQPANIGSSEGMLDEQVVFDVAGTPAKGDTILHIDILFQDGEGRTKEGIRAAHHLTDIIVEEIRKVMLENLANISDSETFQMSIRQNTKKIVLVKLVSGLGNMYDTTLFPNQPAGYTGSYPIMNFMNMPVMVSPNQILDGVIHSLL